MEEGGVTLTEAEAEDIFASEDEDDSPGGGKEGRTASAAPAPKGSVAETSERSVSVAEVGRAGRRLKRSLEAVEDVNNDREVDEDEDLFDSDAVDASSTSATASVVLPIGNGGGVGNLEAGSSATSLLNATDSEKRLEGETLDFETTSGGEVEVDDTPNNTRPLKYRRIVAVEDEDE